MCTDKHGNTVHKAKDKSLQNSNSFEGEYLV